MPPPGGESLKDTVARVLPYYIREILPRVMRGERVLVAAHGNSLRAIVKHLFQVSEADIVNVEIPTGNPLAIVLDDHLDPLSARYLDDSRAEKIPAFAKSAP